MEVDTMRTTRANAVVVRQFVPSRIERQVLAQVFELVFGLGRESEQVRSTSRDTAPAGSVAAIEPQAETVVGRNAA